jgi:hypothetical protein
MPLHLLRNLLANSVIHDTIDIFDSKKSINSLIREIQNNKSINKSYRLGWLIKHSAKKKKYYYTIEVR